MKTPKPAFWESEKNECELKERVCWDKMWQMTYQVKYMWQLSIVTCCEHYKAI